MIRASDLSPAVRAKLGIVTKKGRPKQDESANRQFVHSGVGANAGKGKGWSAGLKFAKRQECQVCGFRFYADARRLRLGHGKFCSNSCYGRAKRSETTVATRSCRRCGTTITSPKDAVQKVCDSCVSFRKMRRANRPSRRKSNCAHCRVPIVGVKKYCNKDCYNAFRAAHPTGRGVKPTAACKTCRKPFYASPGHKAAGWGNYCSMKCRPLPLHGAAKGGTREDLGIYVRSSWEANYARYLKWLVAHGQIKAWEFEPVTFYFEQIKRGTRSYCPDFRVTENSGAQVFHEVKGYLDPKSKTKLARMKKFYPNETVILIQQPQMREIKAKLSKLIPHWEYGENDKLYTTRVRHTTGLLRF